jgi:hypothetical protein
MTRTVNRLCQFDMADWEQDQLSVRTAGRRSVSAISGACPARYSRCTTPWCGG